MKLATLVYVRAHERTLMLHRVKKPNDMHAGKWNGLGGKLEPGETPEECAIREVAEESGLHLTDPILRGMIVFPQFANGEDWFIFVLTADRFTGELIDSPEGVLAWVEDERLMRLNLWPGDRIFMRWLDDPRMFSAKFVYSAGELTNYEVVFYTPGGGLERERRELRDATMASFTPVYTPAVDTYCWICGGAVVKRHCKIVCPSCGFTRDCSDP